MSGVKLELSLLCVMILIGHSMVIVAPFIRTAQSRGHLAQQVVLTVMTADVAGRLLAATPFASQLKLLHVGVLSLVPIAGAVTLVLYGSVDMFVWDAFPCILAGTTATVCGFIFCVANQMVLEKFPLQYSPKLMCIVNILAGAMYVVAAATALCVHLGSA